MRGRRRGWVAVGFAALLVVSMSGSGVAVQSPAVDSVQVNDDADTIEHTQTYERRPAQPGSVAVELRYDVPDRVTSLRATLPAGATVTGTDGFERVNDTVYEWDGATSRATIDLRYNPNRTTDRTGLEAAGGSVLYTDVGEWALFGRMDTAARWRYTGREGDDPVTFERSVEVAGPGATGGELIYLGEVSEYERRANGQTFRLVVPEAAELDESRTAIMDSMAAASRSMQVGARDEEVVAIAAPTNRVEWGVRGLETGGSDFYVRDFERLDTPSNVWLHEYVHTRQTFSTSDETRWTQEATAVYYAALLALEQEHVTFTEFRAFLANGGRDTYGDVVLSDPATWTRNANYVKGALVAGRIDEAMRAETGGTGTLEATVRAMNARRSRVTQAAFLDAVEAYAGPDARESAVSYTETSRPVSMWDDSTHSRLFGTLPASVSYELPNSTDGYRASGPYRNGAVRTTPPALATGETLTVESLVRNTGGEAGEYNATLTVDGEAVATETGTIGAESQRVVPLSHTFDEPGEYTVGVGDETVPVRVEPAAEPAVTNLTVSPRTVQQGERAEVTLTVGNSAAVPANGTVAVTRNGEPATQRVVTLGPGNTTRLAVAIPFPEAGEIQVGAGSADPVTVTVEGGLVGVAGPGFTPVAALVAVALGLLVGRRLE
jgi:hypothetical protein